MLSVLFHNDTITHFLYNPLRKPYQLAKPEFICDLTLISNTALRTPDDYTVTLYRVSFLPHPR